MDLSIIIVNYNVKEFLLNLLESIHNAVKDLNVEIIVVDNNSHDGSISSVNQKFPEVITISNKENVGFGKANNQGLEISKGKYILLINPDTLVREDTLIKTIDFLKNNEDAGLVGCKVLNPDGTIQLACRRSFPGPWVSFTKVTGLSTIFPKSKLFARYNLTYKDENESYEVDAVSGSFMMLSRKTYEKTGGFDTDFFMYGEDLDLCYRVQKEGMKVYYFSNTEIIHYKGESTKRSTIDETKIFYKAMHQFVRKHFSSSIFIEAILQFGIILRKILAFANVNKYIIIGLLLDFLLYSFALQAAEKFYTSTKWIGFPEIYKPWVYIVPSVFQIIISAVFGAYRKNSLSVLRSFISLVIGLVIITSSTFFLKQFAFSRAVVLINYGLSAFFFLLWRMVLKFSFLKSSISQDTYSNAVIVGTDDKAIQLENKLTKNLSSPYKIKGFIGKEISDIGKQIDQKEIIGSLGNLKKVIAEHSVSNVIFSSEPVEFDKIFSVIAECQGENVNFLVSGNELDYMVGKSNISHIEDVPLLKVDYNISRFSHKTIKRLFDIFVSVIPIVLVYPFFIVVSKVLKLEGEFTNMVKNLPNIFLGKKSFVGPQFIDDNSELYFGRPGLTGLWYVENITKNDLNENKRLDLFYAKNQNIWLDLEILGKSIAKYAISRRKNV